MSSQSADTLFHFTPSLGNLLSILQNEFQPKHCLEKLQVGHSIVEAAFPIICFCDIPLSQMRPHIDVYGHYGIGMSKDWGKAHGLNPVLYMAPASDVGNSISEVGFTLAQEQTKQLAHGASELLQLIGYLKAYSGDFTRHDKTSIDVRFYDEREWRLVIRNNPGYLSKEQFRDPNTRAIADQGIQNKVLSFEATDIKYVIVDRDAERVPTVRALREIKSARYSPDVIEDLTSRIVTCEQLTKDY